MDVKQHIVKVGQQWITTQIDMAVEHNPRLSFIARRLKDGLCNTLANKIDRIDPYLPFITDERGNMNIGSVSDELLGAFDEMPVRDYDFMGLDVSVGKGKIVVSFPDNIFTNIFLDHNRLTFGKEDLMDLVKLLNEK